MSNYIQRESARYRRTDIEVRHKMISLGRLSKPAILGHHEYGSIKTCLKCGQEVINTKYQPSESDRYFGNDFQWPEYMLRTCDTCSFEWRESMPKI